MGSWQPWTMVDLSTLDWQLGFERAVSLATLAMGLPLLVLVGCVVVDRIRTGVRRGKAPWRAASASAPLIAIPLILFTTLVLATDAQRSPWTLARQNLGALRGDAGCGIADHLRVRVPASTQPIAISEGSPPGPVPAWVPAPPVRGTMVFALGPIRAKRAITPWFRAPRSKRIGVFATGLSTEADQLELEWGRSRRGGGIKPLRSATTGIDLQAGTTGVEPWLFIPASELPNRPVAADAVRLTLANEASGSSGALAVTSPVSYSNQAVTPLLSTESVTALVNTSLVSYLPCATQPTLRAGIAGAPRFIFALSAFASPPVDYPSSPFRGVADIYTLERVILTDSDVLLPGVDLYRVHKRIDGRIAPPKATVIRS